MFHLYNLLPRMVVAATISDSDKVNKDNNKLSIGPLSHNITYTA